MSKISWQDCDHTKELILQASDICRFGLVIRAIWGAALVKGAFELKDFHFDVRTDFSHHTKKENWNKNYNSPACHLIPSVPSSTSISS